MVARANPHPSITANPVTEELSPPRLPTPIPHALTVDVEAWFHAHNLEIPSSSWDHLPARVEQSVQEILDLLDQHQTKGTFFVLGWIAQRFPALIREIERQGHEIASHGFHHKRIGDQTPDQFRLDIRNAKAELERITGRRVNGYRAPSYSVTSETAWAVDVMVEEGFTYDSSVYPARAPHGRYGWPGAPRGPYRIRPDLWEFPLPTLRVAGRLMPAATGAYLRHAPLAVTRRAMRQLAERGLPAVINVHPWEFDVHQPRVSTGFLRRLLHYGNLAQTHGKIEKLLGDGRFVTLREMVALFEPHVSKPAQTIAVPRVVPSARADAHAIGRD